MSLFGFLSALFALATVIACVWLFTRDPESLAGKPAVRLGVVTLSPIAAYKLGALLAILVLPVGAALSAHTDLVIGAKETDACGECHVMTPMVTDMRDPTSDTLAARHYNRGYISSHACYTCHSGYGLSGAFDAKLEGYRHLVRYTTGLFEEPIEKRGRFDQSSCLNCHRGKANYVAINSHTVAAARLESNETSCLNCHGLVHPLRSERTPGHSRYDELMDVSAPSLAAGK